MCPHFPPCSLFPIYAVFWDSQCDVGDRAMHQESEDQGLNPYLWKLIGGVVLVKALLKSLSYLGSPIRVAISRFSLDGTEHTPAAFKEGFHKSPLRY